MKGLLILANLSSRNLSEVILNNLGPVIKKSNMRRPKITAVWRDMTPTGGDPARRRMGVGGGWGVGVAHTAASGESPLCSPCHPVSGVRLIVS